MIVSLLGVLSRTNALAAEYILSSQNILIVRDLYNRLDNSSSLINKTVIRKIFVKIIILN